jgi:ribosome-associated heat shock protein Hsp15
MPGATEVRIDKWLWAVRLYQTRSRAIQACDAGHVKINNARIKPSRPVRGGEMVTAVTGGVTRTVKVLAVLERRVGASLVDQYLQDLTPPEEYARAREATRAPRFPQGFGRPTKKQRRQLEGWARPGEEN